MNYLFLILLIACAAYAFWKGGAPERIGMAIYVAGSILTFVVVSAPPVRFQGVEVGVFIVDLFVFLGFVAVAVKAERFWPLWVSALIGIGIVGHLAMALHPHVIPWAYAVVLSIWSYPILLLMVLGAFAHDRRRKRNGADPSWTPSSAPPGPLMPPAGPTP